MLLKTRAFGRCQT